MELPEPPEPLVAGSLAPFAAVQGAAQLREVPLDSNANRELTGMRQRLAPAQKII